MEEFCGSKYWDSNLSWNTTDPYLTYCFEESTLSLFPFAFLILFGLSDILNISRSKYRSQLSLSSLSIFIIVKSILNLALILVYIVHLIRVNTADLTNSMDKLETVDVVSPTLQLSGYVLMLCLSFLTYYFGICSSGVQFLYWLTTLICQGVLFRTALGNYNNDDVTEKEEIIYLTRLIAFPLILTRFLMEWFSEEMFKSSSDNKIRLGKPSPDKTSTFISKLLFLWYDSLAWTGYKRLLTKEDLWDLNPADKSEAQYGRFSKYWKKEEEKYSSKKKSDPKSENLAGIMKPLYKSYGGTFAFAMALKITADLLVFVQPEMVRSLVAHVTNSDEADWKGYLYTATLVISAIVQSILVGASNKRALLLGMRVRTSLSNAVFRKALVISNASKRESTVGEIVNLMSVDAQKFTELMPVINMAVGSPLQIIISIYLLYNTLGPSVFAGLGIMLLLIPLNGFFGNLSRKYQMAQMKLKDERIKLTSEVMGGIKVLKLYGWELSYQEQIEAIRTKEIGYLRKSYLLNTVIAFTFNCAPVLVALATFATYTLSDPSNLLNAEKTFVAISLFNIIRMPMVMLPMMVTLMINVSVSVKRLNRYLNMDELDKNAVTHDDKYDDPIVIKDGSFSWTDENTTLKNINFNVKNGELIAVVGTIGSGKTSLLCSLLGDLKKDAGIVNTKGNLAYVSQGAWIQNATLRDNILFGDVLNKTKYDKVLEACSLLTDLEILQSGDQTEIGEKGMNLSGGQKQRVALARAAYKESSIYLFDDPLSAVDAHVGKHIFEQLIGPDGFLKKTTRVLVTHGIGFLPKVDRIIVMKDGQISETGTYKELLMKQGEFADFLLQHLGIEDDVEEIDEDRLSVMQDLELAIGATSELDDGFSEDEQFRKSSVHRESLIRILKRFPSKESTTEKQIISTKHVEQQGLEPKNDKKLIADEAMAQGNVKFSIYLDYFKSGGFVLGAISVFLVIAANGLTAYSNIWLSDWSSEVTKQELETGATTTATTNKYLIGYGSIGAVQALATFGGNAALAMLSLYATSNLHFNALKRVMHAPMSYFDTTLLGRLINRFSRDVDTVDNLIVMNLRAFTNILISVFATFIVISMETPIFIAFIIPMAIIYFFLQRFYIATSRQLKRLESVTRSPIYSHFSETVSGCTTIRAFRLEDEFVAESAKRIDDNQQSYFPFIVSNMWISVRLEFMGAFIIFATCIFTLISRSTLDPGSAGLAISYALQVTQLLNFLARQMSDLETNIVSVERVNELKETPQEAEWEKPGNKLSPNWPEKGEVQFVNYMTRYREGLDLVLRGITCTIHSGEKIGVVGRTGAGKSSFTLALFRLIESAGGSIYVDGIDVSTLGLHELRKKITIIPQDPVLFSGTLRLNLDPFNYYSDEQVWKCLELAHLKPYIVTLSEGLSYKVEEEGKNFSVGQRQLICLARALLRKTKILVLDEATAAVDLETDDLIQATIRAEFRDSSVITIAHRLNTIMDSNRVLVLDKGEIIEFDSPENLLADSTTVFWGMAHDAKLV